MQDKTLVRENNRLSIGGMDVGELVTAFGSPLVVIDGDQMTGIINEYKNNFKNDPQVEVEILYASKAFMAPGIIKVIDDLKLGLDVVSGGELYTALKSGFSPKRIIFHGNNKGYDELKLALDNRVSRIVVDNDDELSNLEFMAEKSGYVPNIFLRITPGVDAHTHDFVKTGNIDSKFGFTLSNGDALNAVRRAVKSNHVNLVGLHCHIGSQIFNMTSFGESTEIMLNFLKEIKDDLNYEIEELDMGGGFGIHYTDEDEPAEIKDYSQSLLGTVKRLCPELGLTIPKIYIEPGRSLIGPCGYNIYTVGTIKDIPGINKYVAVDGGMSDNIRPALYGAKYEVFVDGNVQNRELEKVDIVGKCCESGDILRKDIILPAVKSGDHLVFTSTGAYGYSMASNYNLIGRPCVVMIKDGVVKEIIKRETFENIVDLFNF